VVTSSRVVVVVASWRGVADRFGVPEDRGPKHREMMTKRCMVLMELVGGRQEAG
jgi:hypothetical protein